MLDTNICAGSRARHEQRADAFFARLDAVLPRKGAVDTTTENKVVLRLAGTPSGPNDTAIAGHDITASAVLPGSLSGCRVGCQTGQNTPAQTRYFCRSALFRGEGCQAPASFFSGSEGCMNSLITLTRLPAAVCNLNNRQASK